MLLATFYNQPTNFFISFFIKNSIKYAELKYHVIFTMFFVIFSAIVRLKFIQKDFLACAPPAVSEN